MKEALRKEQKWNSSGVDKAPNFWLNALDSTHENMINCSNRAITNPETNPQWFTQGITYVLPKSNRKRLP